MIKTISINLNELESGFLQAMFKPKESSFEEFCSVLKRGLMSYPHLVCAMQDVLTPELIEKVLDKASKDFCLDFNLYMLEGDTDGI